MKRKNLVPKLVLEPVYLVSEQKLTAETIAEANRLNDDIRNIKQDLLDIQREEENHPLVKAWRLRKNELINRWAKDLRRLGELGVWDKPIDWISTHIAGEMRSLQFNDNEVDYVNRVLPKEFKRESLANNIGRNIPSNLTPDYNEVINIGFKDIDSYKPDELVDYVQKADGQEKLLKDRFKTILNNLELNKEHAEEIIKEKKISYTPIEPQKKDVISTIPPDPKESESWNACIEIWNSLNENKYVESWAKLAEKLKKYPPEDKKQDVEIARFLKAKHQSIETESRMIRSFTDDKYAFSLWQWCKVIVDEDDYGKHAAAVKNKVNPKQGPGGPGVTKKPRPLTRERVGDTKGDYWEYMKDLAESMEYDCWWKGVAEIWDIECHAPYNADRRNMESPKLSETAFGSSSDEE